MEITSLVRELADVDIFNADVESCTEVLQGCSQVIAWAEATKIAAAQRLATLAAVSPEICPEHVVATATRTSLGDALRPFKRAAAVNALPQFSEALKGGAVSVAHVDILAAALGKLDGDERHRLESRGDFLIGVAEHATPQEFAKTVRTEVLRLQRGDGLERLRQQKLATFLRTWLDQTTGMWCIRGEFDPETGARLNKRLQRTVEQLFHDSTPDTAPSDPLDKQHHLRALALAALIDGTGSKPAAADMSILIDAKTLLDGHHNGSVVDFGLPIDLPLDTVRRMACLAEITPIIVGADGVRLFVGTTTRLATPEQRKVLRAIYRGCAVPGCCVAWDYVVIHHVKYFRHRGPTDIDNLLPMCVKHHHLAHEGGWKLSLAADRALTIIRPDGSVMTTGPPSALAA
jgi:hypothetical protein